MSNNCELFFICFSYLEFDVTFFNRQPESADATGSESLTVSEFTTPEISMFSNFIWMYEKKHCRDVKNWKKIKIDYQCTYYFCHVEESRAPPLPEISSEIFKPDVTCFVIVKSDLAKQGKLFSAIS